jgi:hypothetical protein
MIAKLRSYCQTSTGKRRRNLKGGSKSGEVHSSCGFDPHLGHHRFLYKIASNLSFSRQSSVNQVWNTVMLTVYRRHLRTCKSGHKEELRTSEFDERKKGWKDRAFPPTRHPSQMMSLIASMPPGPGHRPWGVRT